MERRKQEQTPVVQGGNTLFRAMMASTAAAFELHPQTFQPIGERAVRVAAIQLAAEQTYAGNIAYSQARERQEAAAVAHAELALANTEVILTSI